MSAQVNLRRLDYSPSENPFVEGAEIMTKHKTVRTRTSPRELMDPETGEVVGQSIPNNWRTCRTHSSKARTPPAV